MIFVNLNKSMLFLQYFVSLVTRDFQIHIVFSVEKKIRESIFDKLVNLKSNLEPQKVKKKTLYGLINTSGIKHNLYIIFCTPFLIISFLYPEDNNYCGLHMKFLILDQFKVLLFVNIL